MAHPDLLMGGDDRFEHRWWWFERFSWAAMTVLLVLAALGSFGRGRWANAMAGSDGLRVKYEKTLRTGGSTEQRLTLDPVLARGDRVYLRLSGNALERLPVMRVLPEPVEFKAAGDAVQLAFAVADPSRPLTIALGRMPEKPGRVLTRIEIDGGPAATFEQHILP